MSPRRASRIIVAFVLVVLSSSRSARADEAQEARASFERGVEASRDERWEEARKQFKRSLELTPKASTMFNLVVADIKLGLGREALEQLDAFERSAHPEEHAAMLERARVLRPQAQALVQSEQSKAQNGGNALSEAEAELTDEVRREVELAREHYANGRDKEALTAFEHAYKASKRPQLLYNIGVVADRMRADGRAIRAYEAFIAALPDAPEAAVAQVRSESLREALLAREHGGGQLAPAPAPVIVQQAPPADAGPSLDLTAPRTLLISGAVLAAVAGGTLGWYIETSLDADECAEKKTCTEDSESAIERDRRAALALTAVSASVAVGLTIAGAVLLRKRKLARGSATLAPWVTPRAAGLGLHASF